MRCAAFIPTRGSSDSCAASAVLMLTTPDCVACTSAANALAHIVATRIPRTRMVWDFRMGLGLLSVCCLLLADFHTELLSHHSASGTLGFTSPPSAAP